MSSDSDREQADRFVEALAKAESIQPFLDWLCSPQDIGNLTVQLCIAWEITVQCAEEPVLRTRIEWKPVENAGELGEALLATYFGIDLDAVERHRRAILDRMGSGVPHPMADGGSGPTTGEPKFAGGLDPSQIPNHSLADVLAYEFGRLRAQAATPDEVQRIERAREKLEAAILGKAPRV
jgi:hypothetical protein